MKIFLIIFFCFVGWLVSAVLSALIVKRFFLVGNNKFWEIVCTFFAPATLIVLIIILPFYLIYNIVDSILW